MKLRLIKLCDGFLNFILRLLKQKNASNQFKKPSSILIIKLSAMGDALCLMPSVRMLSKAFPTAHIDWWTTSRTHPEIFQALDFLNKIEILPSNPFRMVFRL